MTKSITNKTIIPIRKGIFEKNGFGFFIEENYFFIEGSKFLKCVVKGSKCIPVVISGLIKSIEPGNGNKYLFSINNKKTRAQIDACCTEWILIENEITFELTPYS